MEMKLFKLLIDKYLPVIPVAAVLAGAFFSPSCANTTTPPSGGVKDTIPPVIVGLNPLPGTANFPVDGKIEIEFNEYFTVKDAKGIFLSPPQKKSPKYRIRGRKLVVYFEEALREGTTYTLDLQNGAVADNNEGNLYPGYTLSFSTGDRLDSMAVTGTVRDYKTLQPVKGATVMLYRDHSDSAVFKQRPDAAVKTDDWGYFAIRNVADTLFRIYAIQDEGSDNLYNPDNDLIAFGDSVFRPTMVASDTLKELMKYDMKDTAACMARNSQHELLLFREKPSKQYIVNKMRTSDRSAYITFMAPGAEIDSLWVGGVPSSRLIMQFNPERDSLELWINDRRRMPDTLNVYVDYLKTDSLGVPSPFTERLRLASEKKKSKRQSWRDLKHEDTLCVYSVSAAPETVEQYGFGIEFNNPIIREGFDSVKLVSVNPRQQKALMAFSVSRDSVNLRKYTLTPGEELRPGYEYTLKVPGRMFRDINGFYNDSTEVKVSLPNDDKLSTFTLEISGVQARYLVELLDEKRTKVLRSYSISADSSLRFPYLKKGKYSLRLTEDRNGNGIVDSGSLLGHVQSEKVRFLTLKDGSYVIEIPEGAEIEQKVKIQDLF